MPYVVTCVIHCTPFHPLFYDICHINLCKACVGNHVWDESKLHIMVPVKHRQSLLMYFKMPRAYVKTVQTPLWAMWHSYLCSMCFLQDTYGSRCSRYSTFVFGKKEKSLTSRFRRARKYNLSKISRDCINNSGSEGRFEKKHRTIDNSSQWTGRRLAQRNRRRYQ